MDGRPHLEQAKPVLAARKPLFIDKPIAGSLRDAVEIFRLAKEQGTPVFSSSSLRFATNTQAVRNGSVGKVLFAETYGPCELEPHHPDLFWYGIHGVETLFTIMGPGCKTVSRAHTKGVDVVTGETDFARCRFDQPQQAASRRRLAAAGLADEAERLTLVDREAHVVHGVDVGAMAKQATAAPEVLDEM